MTDHRIPERRDPVRCQYPVLSKLLAIKQHISSKYGGVEFAGPENYGPKKIKGWKMQNLKMPDLAGVEMQDLKPVSYTHLTLPTNREV